MIWLSILVIALVALNVLATIAVARSNYPTRRQLMLQLVAVWLLPALGAAGLLLFVRSQGGYGPDKGFEPLYTPGDGGQPQQGWIPASSDFTDSGGGGSSD